jgi:hypothetical protein
VIGGGLILAMGCRETWLRNIVGDYGNGRGFMQIDHRWHAEWLDTVRGCRSGEWQPIYSSALPAGRVPPLRPMTRYAIHLLHGNYAYAKQNDIPQGDLVPVIVAGFNCGVGYAVRGYREGNVDKYTAWGNYSRDVLRNKLPHVREYLQSR